MDWGEILLIAGVCFPVLITVVAFAVGGYKAKQRKEKALQAVAEAQSKEDRTFLFLWMAANAVAFLIGGLILEGISTPEPPSAIVRGLILGIIVGIAQSFVLQIQVHHPIWWILATALGVSIGHVVAEMVYNPAPNEWGPNPILIAWPITGVALGISQWVVLLRQLRWSVLWILATAIGLAIGPVMLFYGGFCLGPALMGWSYGVTTGSMLILLKNLSS